MCIGAAAGAPASDLTVLTKLRAHERGIKLRHAQIFRAALGETTRHKSSAFRVLSSRSGCPRDFARALRLRLPVKNYKLPATRVDLARKIVSDTYMNLARDERKLTFTSSFFFIPLLLLFRGYAEKGKEGGAGDAVLRESSKIALVHNGLNTGRAIPLIYDFTQTTGWAPAHKVAAFTSLFRVNTRELTLICKA